MIKKFEYSSSNSEHFVRNQIQAAFRSYSELKVKILLLNFFGFAGPGHPRLAGTYSICTKSTPDGLMAGRLSYFFDIFILFMKIQSESCSRVGYFGWCSLYVCINTDKHSWDSVVL